MLKRESTKFGVITYDDNLVFQIVLHALQAWEGKVWPVSYNDNIPDAVLLFRNAGELAPEIQCSWSDAGVLVNINVILMFGISIKTFAKDVICAAAADIQSSLGMQIDDIRIHVTGVAAKRVAKRDMIISYKGLLEETIITNGLNALRENKDGC